jgi:hypothetical protein
MKYLRGLFCISAGPFGGDGEGATIQIFFNRREGDSIRAFAYGSDYWFSSKKISDNGLQYLIENWDKIKNGIHKGIEEGFYMLNLGRKNKLEKQLRLHESIKNFQV